jgi:hypothetical protein
MLNHNFFIMKTRNSFFRWVLIFTALVLIATNCPRDEEEPLELEIESLMAGDIDLLNTSDPVLPVDAEIKVLFTANLDPVTANSTNISLVQDYDGSSVDLKIWVSGPNIKITPLETLASGALYQLSIKTGVKTMLDKSLAPWTTSFRTEGSFAPGGALAHWTFEENANDVIGNYDPSASGVVEITYTDSRNAAAGKAATFDGDISIIEIPNGDKLIDATDLTISFWMKANSTDHLCCCDNDCWPAQHYIIGVGIYAGFFFATTSDYTGIYSFFSYVDSKGSEMTSWTQGIGFGANATTEGIIEYAKNITTNEVIALYKDNWLHLVYTFNYDQDTQTRKAILYHNGEKMISVDYNLSEFEDVRDIVGIKYTGKEPEFYNDLAFGFYESRRCTCWDEYCWGGYDFPESNHFKGQLDDVRFWHKTLTPEEISMMYEAEKP